MSSNRGTRCVWKNTLNVEIDEERWRNTGDMQISNYVVDNQIDNAYLGQFAGSIKIISKEIKNRLADTSKRKLQKVFYYFFTDGENHYPLKEV